MNEIIYVSEYVRSINGGVYLFWCTVPACPPLSETSGVFFVSPYPSFLSSSLFAVFPLHGSLILSTLCYNSFRGVWGMNE